MSIITGLPKPVLLPYYESTSTTYYIPNTLGIIHAPSTLIQNNTYNWILPLLSSIQIGALLWIDNSSNVNISLLVNLNSTDTINGTYAYICTSQSITVVYSGPNGWRAGSYLNNLGSLTPNIIYGTGVLQNNTTGHYNTAIGYQALKDNTTGSSNTMIGFNTMLYAANASYNTGIGSYALSDASDNVVYNTAVGANALESCNGNNNTSIGYNSMQSALTAGSNDNTVIGYNAGNKLSGSQNVLLGSTASINLLGSNNILIGYNSGANLIGNSSTGTLIPCNGNIYIGNISGASTDNGVIRIGEGQSVVYVTGPTPISQESLAYNITLPNTQLSAIDFLGGIVTSNMNFTLPTQLDLDTNIPGITYKNLYYVVKCLIVNTNTTSSITLSAGTNTVLAFSGIILANDSRLVYMQRIYNSSNNTTSYNIY